MQVNGEHRALEPGTTLADALLQWGYACERVAVAINGEFVARADYAHTLLRARDCLDVVAPVQGG
jgi:sulfur carrier protein